MSSIALASRPPSPNAARSGGALKGHESPKRLVDGGLTVSFGQTACAREGVLGARSYTRGGGGRLCVLREPDLRHVGVLPSCPGCTKRLEPNRSRLVALGKITYSDSGQAVFPGRTAQPSAAAPWILPCFEPDWMAAFASVPQHRLRA